MVVHKLRWHLYVAPKTAASQPSHVISFIFSSVGTRELLTWILMLDSLSLPLLDASHSLYLIEKPSHHELSRSASPGKSGVPLIVNTPGWVKGIGYDLLVDMLKHIAPSHVVNICISAKSKNLPSGAFWSQDGDAGAVTLIEINSARQDSLNRSVLVQKDSRHLRDLSIVTYFRQCFPSDMSISTIKEVARALAAHPPYEVPVSAVSIKHLHCEVPKDEIFYSLNATIVGLAVNSEDSGHLPRCVGLGIVRGVDILRRVLYIITPVPQNVVEDVDVLLQGFIQIPTYLLQVQGSVSPYMASNVLPGI
ncbi:polynucleotide 5'-hydroxyl-kinase NOL9 isoform X4 [Cynara cardunculus var. scolymus]|uniref:polynucleotide 5'-hydroxyl-kinase NOL9 isoform X4 n=1 Tax=Cynara cardunculus var. scolymus TaxID=59895 RepID=UPI000D62DDA7|nr:polynucleotide 5'-hydroxyl-kinase NOL9 isoform X4 [Cynara cardunculus var. scolymus]